MMFSSSYKDRRDIGSWLLLTAFLVFVMVMVGGATRLTESGLSIVEWKPVTGALPPLSDVDWTEEFQKYQQSPEYKLKNEGMSLEDFKGIFYWEWGHRLLGRLIGFVFLVPFIWFWVKGRIPPGYKSKLSFLFLLGGAQGALGWYMVMSGLVNEPAVSHYRLTAHLSLALVIFAALMWTGLSLLRTAPGQGTHGLKRLTHVAMLVLVLQIVMGALVAGLKAGHIFNTWPLMGDTLVPEGLLHIEPWWRNMLDNAITVQFDHRIGAYALTALAVALVLKTWAEAPALKLASLLVLVAVLMQATLGIITLLMDVPVFWGTIHQGGGVIVLATMINFMHLQRGGETI